MKDKICLICHTAIDVDNEFCKFEHYYNKDNIRSKAWYHVNCFRDKMIGNQQQIVLAKQAQEMINKVNSIIN